MGELIGTIAEIVIKAIEVAIATRKSLRAALAESLRDAADKIEKGELLVDDALIRAKADQAKIDQLRRRVGN